MMIKNHIQQQSGGHESHELQLGLTLDRSGRRIGAPRAVGNSMSAS